MFNFASKKLYIFEMRKDFIKKAYDFLVEKNDPESAIRALKNFGDPENFPEVLMILTHAHRLLLHFDEAEYYANKLMKFPEWQPHALWSIGSIEARKGNLKRGLELLEKAKEGLLKTRYYPSVLLDIGTTYWVMGNETQAYKILVRGLEVAKNLGNFPLLAAILGNLSIITWNLNRYRESLEYAYKSLEIARRYNWQHTMCHILSNLVVHYGDLGDYNSGRKIFEEALQGNCDRFSDVKIQLYMGTALIEMEAGNISKALKKLNKIDKDAFILEDRRLASEYYILMASVFYRLKNYKKALESVDKAGELWNIKGTTSQQAASVFRNLILARMGEEHDEIDPESDFYGDWNYFLPIMIRYFYDRGEPEIAFNLCKKMATERKTFMGNLLVFWDEIETVMPYCLERAINDTEILSFLLNTGEKKVIKEVCNRVEVNRLLDIISGSEYPPFVFSIVVNKLTPDIYDDFYRVRESYRSSHPLRINTLGNFELWIGDYKIPDTEWRRPFALDVLKFFITYRNRWLERDYIYESLWPGESPESSASKLRVYLNYIRKTLEPWKLRNEKSDLIVWKGGSYGFFTGNLVFLDVEEFEDASKRGFSLLRQRNSDGAIYQFEKALDHYRGSYLTDDKYLSWAEMERIRLKNLYLSTVESYASLLLERGLFKSADYHLYRAFLEDPTDETIVETYLNLLISAGVTNQAIKIFKLYEEQLAKKYDLPPSTKIRRIIENIENQKPT